ncbi:MAG: SUMF1/EgtB/PvdO family nonheme iron enzyme [Treponema sp.]|jgi:hypothetical protein|nr:SUMF1/EgtB/PvdO family nonheme iron enzyme [Treponema sp.]
MFGRKKIEILPEDRVKLPVILGINPGHYLAVIYGIAALFVVFLILIYPGLSNPGSVGIISSEPSGAAVRIDGVTLGVSPCEIFLPKGTRTVEMVLPGFESYTVTLDVGSGIFAANLFPKKIPVDGILLTSDPVGALTGEAADYAWWTFAGEPTETRQIPLSLSEGAYRTGPAAANPELKREMDAVLRSALRFASTRAAARDLARAKFLVDNSGLSPSPLTLVRSIREAVSYAGNVPEEPLNAWLAGLSGPSRQGGDDGDEGTGMAIRIIPSRAPALSPVILNGQEFIPVTGGFFEKGGVETEIPPMLVARTEVPASSWDAFAGENPEWAGYRMPENASYPAPAVPEVSWYGARAYCRWLSGRLPPALSGWEIRLPAESEWNYTALYFAGSPEGRQTPVNLSGGLWEWCGDPYAPLDFFPRSSADNGLGSPEYPVKGGSWINPPGTVNPGDRASLPPDSSSPFVGFRPILTPKSPALP